MYGERIGGIYRCGERVAHGDGLGMDVTMRVVKMVCGIAKGVDFQLGKEVLG